MARTSVNLGLIIPEQTDYYDVSVHETNYEILDDVVGGNNTVFANLQQEVDAHFENINPHAETANRTIYVGANRDFKTINEAINSVKKELGSRVITILVDEGVYVGNVHVNGFKYGTLTIKANGNVNNTIVNGSVYLRDNTAFIVFDGFTVNAGASQQTIVSERSVFAEIINCTVNGLSTHAGIYGTYTNARVFNNTINGSNYAIRAFIGSLIFSQNNSGTNNSIVYQAADTGVIVRNGTDPTGTTLISELTGGDVRP